MCPPVDVTDDELLRAAARVRAAGSLAPGCRVEVVSREVQSPPDRRGNYGGYTLAKLALWRRPSSDGPMLARQWRDFRRDPDYRHDLAALKGPTLLSGSRATVVSLLLDVPCPLHGSRPWALLLADDGQLGWCYALDALRLLPEFSSPAGDAVSEV